MGNPRPAVPQRLFHSRRAATVVLLLVLVVVPAVAPAVAQGDLTRVGRAYVGAPEADPPYLVTLYTDHPAPDAVPRDQATTFEVELRWRHNDTLVADGPALQGFLFHCVPDDSLGCEADAREATELGASLVPRGQTGRYVWEVAAGRAFDEAGTWRLVIVLADANATAEAASARFDLHVASLPIIDGFGREVLAAFFGFGDNLLFSFLAFLVWLVIFYLVAKGVTVALQRTVLSPRRMDPTVGRLTARMVFGSILVLGLATSLYLVFRADFWAGLTALGLLSVALGFGMQNSVANVMGGINLALDRPFTIGDRVRVGETWGDVQEIGLRSTKIETVRREVVIIPNKLLDEGEIWNFTRGHDEYRLDVDAGISYDSDRKLAEAIMLRIAAAHGEVLDYPKPRVFLQDFGEFSIDLQLRCWIRDAKKARSVASDLRKGIKDTFDARGIEIPFPYRTLVYKSDLEAHPQASEAELKALAIPAGKLPKMLYSSLDAPTDRNVALFVTRLARRLDMDLIVLHHEPGTGRSARWREARFESIWEQAATEQNVSLEAVHRKGRIPDTIVDAARDNDVDLVVLGTGRSGLGGQARKIAEVTRTCREQEKRPVVVVPKDLRLNERSVQHFEKAVATREAERRARGSAAVEGVEVEFEETDEGGTGTRGRTRGE